MLTVAAQRYVVIDGQFDVTALAVHTPPVVLTQQVKPVGMCKINSRGAVFLRASAPGTLADPVAVF